MKIVLITGGLVMLIVVAVRQWQTEKPAIKLWFWPALLCKIVAGFTIGLLYTYYYEAGDTFNFFSDGTKLSSLGRLDPVSYIKFLLWGDESFAVWQHLIFQQPRSLFFTKCISLVNLLTADNYWLTSIYFSSISFIGAWLLVKRLTRAFPAAPLSGVLAFLFFPSVVLWSSGVIKESLAMPCLFYLTALFLKIWQGKRLRFWEWILLLPSGLILWNLKYYYAGIFLPVAVTTLAVRYISRRILTGMSASGQMLLWCGVFVVPLYVVMLFHPNFDPGYLLEVIVLNNEAYTRISSPDNLIYFNDLQPAVWSLLKNAPWAFFSAVYRPFFWEADSWLKFFGACENLLLLAGSVMACWQIRRAIGPGYRVLVLGVAVYIVLLSIFLAFSTPNFGTLARYRIGFLPFFVFLLLRSPLMVHLFSRMRERFFLRLVR